MSTKRIIIYSIIGIVLIFAGYVIYLLATTKNHSPFESITYSVGNTQIKVDYCRPYKKGRVIFGTEDDDALQPYGKYWRLGANEATEIEISEHVIFGGEPLEAGRYVLYAVPGESSWTIGLNSDLGRWGAREVDQEKDVMQVQVPASTTNEPVEQLTLNFTGADSVAFLNIKWDQTHVAVPIETGI